MSSSKPSPSWQQTEPETPSNTSDQSPPRYSESTFRSQQSLPAYSESSEPTSSNQSKSSNVKSALWSFIKGDVHQYHPALVQERYQEIEKKVRAQSANKP